MNVHLKRVLILLLVFTFVFQMAGVTSLSHVQAYADTETEEALVLSDADEAAEVTTEEIDTESPGEIETDGENPPDTAEEPAAPEAASEETAEVPVETPADETVTVEEIAEPAEAEAPMLKAGTKAEKTGTVLAFSSDVHNGGRSGLDNTAANRLETWINKVIEIHGGIDAMAFGGDMGSAYLNGDDFWTYSKNAMDKVPTSISQVHTTGNHEMSNGSFNSTTNSIKSSYKISEIGTEGDDYVIYCLGSTTGTQSSGYTYTTAVDDDQVEKLTKFLDEEKGSRVIFIITHFPLHYLSRQRVTGNADKIIDALNVAANQGKTIVYLWGHNHTDSDANYDSIIGPGSSITYNSSGNSKDIQFYYGAAGCMSDSEYGTGSAYVNGKGLVVTITPNRGTSTMEFKYYNVDNNGLTDVTESTSVKSVDVTLNATASTTEFVQTDTLEAGKEYIIAGEPDSDGNVLMLSNESTGTAKQLKGVQATVSNNTITISDDDVLGKVLFNCVTDTTSTLGGLQLENGGSYLYSSNSDGLSMHTLDSGRCWHYKAYDGDTDKHILWLIKDTVGVDGYTSAGNTYKYYLDYSSGTYFTDKHVENANTIQGTSGLPKIYLYTEAPEGDTYTLSYDANGGTGTMDAQTSKTTYTIKANGFTKEGYEFTKWNTKADGTGTDYEPGASITLTEDTTLYAQWTKATTVNKTVYILTDSLTVGEKYLIVNTNAETSASGAHAIGMNSSAVADDAVTVNAGSALTDNTVYIDSDDVDTTTVWTVGGSSTSPTFAQGSSYLYPSSSGVRIDTTSRAWTAPGSTSTNHYLRYSSGYTNYYLNYNNRWTMTSSSSSSTYQVYFFKETTIKVSVTPSITVEPKTATVGIGDTKTMTATTQNVEGTPTITWSSNNTGVATVDQNGIVTGVATGTATITASMTYEGETYTDTCDVTVKQVNTLTYDYIEEAEAGTSYVIVSNGYALVNNNGAVAAVPATVNGNTVTLLDDEYAETNMLWTLGEDGSFKNVNYYVRRDSGNNKDLLLSTDSPSSNAGYMCFSYDGDYITVVSTSSQGAGTVFYIYYDSGWKSSSTQPEVKTQLYGQTVSVTNITLPATASVAVGGTTTLTATVLPENATNKTVTWSSDNTSVATVDSSTGVITGVAAGTATITATTANGLTATCIVTVSTVSVTSVTISPKPATVAETKTVQLSAEVLPANATNKTVTWSSDNTSIATVDASTGVVTGVAQGTANITATAGDKSDTCEVAVTEYVAPTGYVILIDGYALSNVHAPEGTELVNSTNYHYKGLNGVEYTDAVASNPPDSILWTITETTGGYYIQDSEGNYLNAVYNATTNPTGCNADLKVDNVQDVWELEGTLEEWQIDGSTLKSTNADKSMTYEESVPIFTVRSTGETSTLVDPDHPIETETCYILSNTLEAGGKYLIVNTNEVGDGIALGHSGSSIATDSVKINTGKTETDNKVYIDGEDVDGTSVWTAASGITLSNGTYYMRRRNTGNALAIDTTNSNRSWTWSESNNRLSNGNYYLTYSSDTFSLSSTANSVYLYKETKVISDDTPHTHTYGNPEWTWATDNSSATAKFTCTECDDTQTVTDNAPVETEVTAAGCETNKVVKYTATVTFEEKTYTDTTDNVTVEGTATDHDYGDATYKWTADNSSVTGTRVCSNDATHTITETVNTTSEITKAATCEGKGETTYTAAFTKEGFTTQTKTVENIDALGHDYGNATYEWADNNASVTGTRVCSHDATHTITETVNTTSEITKPATCEGKGETTYTATFTKEGFATQTKTVENINALGHDYGAPVWDWDGVTAATATFTCGNDPTHQVTENAIITNAQGTGEKEGYTVYTATVTFNEETYSDTKDVINQYTLTFKNGDEVVATITEDYGTTITAPAAPTKPFYTFNGWTPAVPETMPAENKTFTATWTAKDAYYLTGSMTNWTVVAANEFIANPDNPAEYSVAATLTASDEIKVVRAVGGVKQEADYYPSTEHPGNNGQTGNYTVDQYHAGNVTVYFRPGGNSDPGWQDFGGYFYIEGDHAITVVTSPENAGTATVMREDSSEAATSAPKGKALTVNVAPADNYQLDKIEIWKTNGGTAAEQTLEGNTFNMPDYDVTVKVYFKAITWTFVDFTWEQTADGYNAIANYRGDNGSTKTVAATVTSSITKAATCEGEGQIVYTATVTAADSLDGTAQSEDKPVVIPAAGHEYGDLIPEVAPDCTTEGTKAHYECSVCYKLFDTNKVETTAEELKIPATGHDWEFVDFSWTGYTAAVANYKCKNDATHTQTVNATVTSVPTPATCETAGKTVYTATVAAEDSLDGKAQTADKTVTIPATGHDWEFTDFTWTGSDEAGYTAAAANYKCKNDATHTQTVNATVTSVTTAATCEVAGKTVYTATVAAADSLDGIAQTADKTVTIPATGHEWSAPEWNWIGSDEAGYTAVEATFICAKDSQHTRTVRTDDVSVISRVEPTPETNGSITYSASITGPDNRVYSIQKEIIIPATGYSYEDPEYTWAETADGYTCTALMACKEDHDRDITETVTATYRVAAAPTCEGKGTGIYTATFTNSKFVTQYKEVEIAATGHDWNDPTYEWNTDHTSVTAAFVCKNDAKHTDTATVSGSAITSEITTQPTATTPGVRTYTASITFGGKTYTATATETIPATGASVSGNIESFVGRTEEGRVTVELFTDGSDTAAYTATVNGSNTSYTFEGVADGTYTMKVSKKDHITRSYEITVNGTAVTQDVKIHLKGDVNGDGKISMIDVGQTNKHVKELEFLTGYAFDCADVNFDGKLSMIDVGQINQHVKELRFLW